MRFPLSAIRLLEASRGEGMIYTPWILPIKLSLFPLLIRIITNLQSSLVSDALFLFASKELYEIFESKDIIRDCKIS